LRTLVKSTTPVVVCPFFLIIGNATANPNFSPSAIVNGWHGTIGTILSPMVTSKYDTKPVIIGFCDISNPDITVSTTGDVKPGEKDSV